MPAFNKQQCQFLLRVVQELQQSITAEVVSVFTEETGYNAVIPQQVATIQQDLVNLGDLFARGIQNEAVRFEGNLNGLIKSAILRARNAAAVRIDESKRAIIAHEQLEHFDSQLTKYDEFLNQVWFQEAEPRRVPRLTDFLTVTRAEARLRLQQPAREYDQKFQVLLSPGLISADLDYYRQTCGLRDRPVSLAYLDIDDFKNFNNKYTEHVVDRDLLPFFARAVESHVYGHGHAYQKGGDEYMIVLPNANEVFAVQLLRDLQSRLASLDYRGIQERTFVSIGLIVADADSFLTNAEMESRANAAKNFAKQHGKNSIASYRGGLFRSQDLYVALQSSESVRGCEGPDNINTSKAAG